MTRDLIDDDHLERLLAGECTPQEITECRSMAIDITGRADALEIMRAALRHDAHWRTLSQRLGLMRGAAELADPAWPRLARHPFAAEAIAPRRGSHIRRVLAMSALVSVVVALVWYGGNVGHRRSPPSTEGAWVTAATGPGQVPSLALPDRARLRIAPASSVWHRESLRSAQREVSSLGEAFFEVAPARRPFKVHAAGVITEDLGTAFDIRAYATDSVVRVAVKSDNVTVCTARCANNTPLVLRSGKSDALVRLMRRRDCLMKHRHTSRGSRVA